MKDYLLIMGGFVFNELDCHDNFIGLSLDEVNKNINDHIDEYGEENIQIFDFKPKKIKLNMVRTTTFDHVEIKD